MEMKAQVAKWVEKKIGRIIDEDLKVKIENEYSQFDVQTYVNSLEDKYFNKVELENLKNNLNSDFQSVVNDFDSYDSDEEIDSKDFLEFANNEFQTFSIDETVKNLESDSEDIRIQSLRALEVYAEEIINHSSWIVVQKILLNILKDRGGKKMHNLILKIFFKFITCNNKPQIVSEGFTSMSKVLASLIKDDNVAYEEVYDLRKEGWLHKKSLSNTGNDHFQKYQKSAVLEVPITLMWLLIYCQQQMPEKWVRFNEKRLREIIFPFFHLLSSTSIGENKNVTALELLSILDPTASWCRSWCHTAVGRNVLCSALRKHKKFFIHTIEIILNKIKTTEISKLLSVRSNEVTSKSYSMEENKYSRYFPEKKATGDENYLKERTKYIRSAPVALAESDRHLIFWRIKENSKWLTERIPKGVVTEALFWHSVSVAVCLIQFRCGQALFPIQIGTRKRPLSAQDLSLSLIEYLENLEYNESGDEEFDFTVAYKAEVLKKIQTLKNIRNNILSSRMKMEGSPIAYN